MARKEGVLTVAHSLLVVQLSSARASCCLLDSVVLSLLDLIWRHARIARS